MKLFITRLARCATILLLTSVITLCLSAEPSLNNETREKTVEAISRLVIEKYTFPEVAEKMALTLREKLQRGDFNAITNGNEFARRLTSELRTLSKDKHLGVRFSADPLVPGYRPDQPNSAEQASFREVQRRENGGVEKAEIVEGNIGYLSLRYFGMAEVAGPAIAGAMQLLAGTDALIVDLRRNSGAIDPGTIAILCSYFFPERRVHLNSLHWREGDRVEQSWTLPLLPGPRYLNKPVYLLTSGRTFSGAEEFAYNLQTRKRAQTVGARTGGGANPGGEEVVTEHFAVWVPTGRALNPVTGTNWEGSGVSPDVEVKPARALLHAHKLALQCSLAGTAAGDGWKEELQRVLAGVEKELAVTTHPFQFRLSGYSTASEVSVVGTFNDWTPGTNIMQRNADGWTATVELEKGKHLYKFWVDGEWLTDPSNSLTEGAGQYTNSVLMLENTF